MITFDSNPVWFIVLDRADPDLCGTVFLRPPSGVLHIGFIYRHVHSWHHRNINIGPWSGLAMHPVESFILMTDVLILLLIPAHPIHILFMMFHHGIGAPASHTGFDKLKVRTWCRHRSR